MVEVFTSKISKINISDSILSFLSKETLEKINSYKNKEDVLRTVTGELLIRTIIQKKLKIKNKDIVFKKNEYGKPYLKNSKNFYFNISHSGEWVVCAISEKEVGIDIELIKPLNLEDVKIFFSKKEYDVFIKKKEDEKLSYFYDIWTLKESFLKAIGKGLYIPPSSFSIRIDKNIIELENVLGKNYKFKQFFIPGYKLSVCSKV